MDPNGDARELELRDYLIVLRRRKGVIAITVAIVVLAALALSFTQKSIYQSTSEVLLQPRTSEQIFSPQDQQAQQQQQQTRVQTEMEVMKSRSVEDAVTKALGRRATVDISANGLTDVVSISAEDH